MCGSSVPTDNSAAIAAQQEEERQARIQEGVTSIDTAFEGFNDDFFNNYQNDYLGYFTPQLDDQYNDAVERLTLNLARSGNLTSSAGANQLADLRREFDTQSTSLTNQALSASNQLRGDVDNRRSQLFADNRAAADPGSAASAAASAATLLQPAAPTTPLSNVFGDFFNNLGNVSAIQNTNRNNNGVQSFNTGGGSGGSSVSVLGN